MKNLFKKISSDEYNNFLLNIMLTICIGTLIILILLVILTIFTYFF